MSWRYPPISLKSRCKPSWRLPRTWSAWPIGWLISGSLLWRWSWIPVYEILESYGLHVVLANARDARAVPGRKTDVNDAQWVQRLHACGLLRASFHPDRKIAALRSYLRLRECHLNYARCCAAHAEGAHPHEFAVAPCIRRHYRGYRHADPPCDCRRRAKHWRPCAIPRC